MEKSDVLKVLDDMGAVRRGHFVLNADGHSEFYVNKSWVCTDPLAISSLCKAMVDRYVDEVGHIEETVLSMMRGAPAVLPEIVVAGPEKGGIIIAHSFAEHLARRWPHRKIRSIYAEKKKDNDKEFVYTRGFDKLISGGTPVIVVEDILTTGKTIRNMIELTRRTGGKVIALCALVNRGGVVTSDVGYPPVFQSLLDLDIPTFMPPDPCPLCDALVPVNTDLGKGEEFLATQAGRVST